MVAWLAMKKNGWRVSVPALSKILFSMVLALGVCAAQAARIIVDSPDDGLNSTTTGNCTLRGAVGAINSGTDGYGCTINDGAYGANDTIVFADTLAGGTVEFTSTITISKPLTIQGPSTAATDPANRVTLKGGGTGSDFRLLDVDNYTSPLTVEDLDFIDGNVTGSGFAGAGAAIRSDSSAVTVSRCSFEGNHAVGWGGAIEANDADVTADASEFRNNRGTYGGAIRADTATVANSTFSGNEAVYGGGAIRAGTATVGNSTFSDNSANVGGAIYASSGATVSASTFSGNKANLDGGAIYAGTTTVANSTFSGNSAGDRGGAIAAATLTGRHLTLVNNTAASGAAVYAFTSADLANSLIAGGDANAQCAGQPGVPFIGAYNLVANMPSNVLTDDTSCGNTHPILIASVSPAITTIDQIVETTLTNHGGPTETLKLAANSPAIGEADQTTGAGATSQMLDATGAWVDATLDQRGSGRKDAATGRDLGAFETNNLTGPTPDTLPDGTVGTIYPTATLGVSGGTGPHTYNVSSGALPPGLELIGDTISGTPTAAGTYTFAVTVADNGAAPPLLTGRSYTIIIGVKATATSIPLLGPGALLLLAGMLGAIGWRGRKQWAGDR